MGHGGGAREMAGVARQSQRVSGVGGAAVERRLS